jgi:hypothetical protein
MEQFMWAWSAVPTGKFRVSETEGELCGNGSDSEIISSAVILISCKFEPM